MLSVDGVCTLAKVVIVDPIKFDLVSQLVLSHGVVMMVVTQMKDCFYCVQFSAYMFFPLVIELFKCLH